MRRLLCLLGIHHWSVPKKYATHNVKRLGVTVGEVTTMMKGCVVPGCCKMHTFTITIGERIAR